MYQLTLKLGTNALALIATILGTSLIQPSNYFTPHQTRPPQQAPDTQTKIHSPQVLSTTTVTPSPSSQPTTYLTKQDLAPRGNSPLTNTPSATPSTNPIPLTQQIPIPATLDTPYGQITYTKIIKNVWATSYDSTCPGCTNTTATGMKQGYGIIAVDPKVIPLYSKVYIPEYGIAVAGDIGGAIKGNKIDLGFDKLEDQWSARYVSVYLLANN